MLIQTNGEEVNVEKPKDRERKFRVWCEYEIDEKIETSMEEACSWFLLTQTGKIMEYGPLRPPQLPNKAYKKLVPLFYTKLKDKNEVEICEGDIIMFEDGVMGVVEMQFYSWVIQVKEGKHTLWDMFFDDVELEIVGNRFENKELIPN